MTIRPDIADVKCMNPVDQAMERLRAAERDRLAAVDELVRLGVVRSRVLVGDLGEHIAARYYGVDLQRAFTPGYDLIDRRGRRVQVKTLRSTPTRPRTILGEVKPPCDVVFALRLDFDYAPTEAIEIPVAVANSHTGANGKVGWTRSLESREGVVHLTAADLARQPDPDESVVQLLGPEIQILDPVGRARVVLVTDQEYRYQWTRLPAEGQEWHPDWGFHPDDDPSRYPPDAAF